MTAPMYLVLVKGPVRIVTMALTGSDETMHRMTNVIANAIKMEISILIASKNFGLEIDSLYLLEYLSPLFSVI